MPGVTTAYQDGDHASRPAANSGCILYACTDHGLVYRSDGSAWSTWATLGDPGGGGSLSRLGTTTIGGSTEQTTLTRHYVKSISVPGEGVIVSVGVYTRARSAGANTGLRGIVYADNAGAFAQVLGSSVDRHVLTTGATSDHPRWLHLPVGVYIPAAGTYHIGVHAENASLDLYYKEGGSDRYNAANWTYAWDGGYNAQTATTRDYSIYAVFQAA